MRSRFLAFNGINGSTGQYLPSPQTVQELARLACDEHLQSEHLQDLRILQWRMSQDEGLAPTDRVDVKDLASTGWGVILAKDCDPVVYEALTPLLEHRKQAAQRRYKDVHGARAYVPGQSKAAVVRKWRANACGAVNTDNMPY